MEREPEYSGISEDRLRAINLNLLPILRELLRFRKISQAAKALNMSQSAVSDALARLRDIFQDELLIPSGRGFTLSEKARQIEPIAQQALDQFEALLGTKPFDPREATGKVQIAAPDAIVLALGRRMVQRIRTDGAKVSVQFHEARDSSLRALAMGLIDFTLVYAHRPPQFGATLKVTHLLDDELVLVGGPRVQEFDHLDGEHLQEIRQLIVHDAVSKKAVTLDEMFLQQSARMELQTILMPPLRLLPLIARSQNTLSIVPRPLAQRLVQSRQFRVSEFELPNISAFAVWHQLRSNDSLHQWVLRIMIDAGLAITAERKRAVDGVVTE